MPAYIQGNDGHHYQVSIEQLKIINLSFNSFGEGDKDHFDKFLNKQTDEFLLILTGNNFEHSTKQKLRKKYKKNLIIWVYIMEILIQSNQPFCIVYLWASAGAS